MTAAFHCTDAYSAISIFEKGIYKSEMMAGDRCLNLYDPARPKNFSLQAQRHGCFIDFDWTSSAIASGANDVENCNFDELYKEQTNLYSPGNIWRWRIRAPYTGNDLLMTAITFSAEDIKNTMINPDNYNKTGMLNRVFKSLNIKSKPEREAERVIKRLSEINHELKKFGGKRIRIVVGH